MKKQQGFALIVTIIIIALVGIGGYAAYKQVQQKKGSIVETSQSANVQTNKDSKSIPEQTGTPTETKIATTVSSAGPLTCNSWDCFVTAAKQCQSASGTIMYSNMPVPIMSMLSSSGKTKYEIKKSGAHCMLTSTILEQSLSINAEERAKLIAQGTTNEEIDAQIKDMNEGATQYLIGKPIVCTATTTAIATYLHDQKNGTGGKASYTSTTGMTSYTTSSGEKVSCTNPG